MARSNDDNRKLGKEKDASKEKISKTQVSTSNHSSKQNKLRNGKTHFQSPYAF